ncbi:MAG: ribonuclease R, partial [Calditrichaeota bacterium]|nr:ribonuclease R [Calditrichota bacterium]
HMFRNALSALEKQGKIHKLKNRRYALPTALQRVNGVIQITRKGFGFVTDERTGEEIFIPPKFLHTAFDGDLVEVQLFAVSRGKSKEGQVSAILQRAHDTFVGIYRRSEYYGFIVPDNPRVYRDFYIQPQNDAGAQDGQKVVVEFLKWDSSALNPEGKIVEILGFPDEPGVDIISLIKGYELPLAFPEKVEKAAGDIDLTISSQTLSERLDLRDELIFTIDPADAKDFDDAVSLIRLENGNYQLGVHIADVSFFVEEGNEIDQEALKRGTSIYLVDRVIPMLPEHLSNELCSLQPDRAKLTYSCIMEINQNGEVVNYQIEPSIIQSKRRFNYEEVQSIIDNPDSDDDYREILREMRDFSQKLRNLRLQEGSIDFETPEVRFVLNENGKPVEIIPVERLESHQLIEEFMLMANKTVARHIGLISDKRKLLPFIYRIHEKPDSEKISNFENFLNALGFKVKIPRNVSPKHFQELMDKVLGTRDDVLIKEVALRTMMKAAYSTRNVGHFGLAFTDYTHFTSPIRRYPDLTVHRLLREYKKIPDHKRIKHLQGYLKKVSDFSSDRERVALDAERESIKIKQVEWIADYIGETFSGLISGVTAYGLFVEITPQLIEGFIRIEDLEDDYYIYDEKTYSMTGKDQGRIYRLGDEISITVKNVNTGLNQVDFVAAEEK